MQVFVKSRDAQEADLLDLSQRRTRFVLRRLAWLVPQATVVMSDVNGPRGGTDKRCQVELRTDLVGTVVVSSVASDWRSALDKALARARGSCFAWCTAAVTQGNCVSAPSCWSDERQPLSIPLPLLRHGSGGTS